MVYVNVNLASFSTAKIDSNPESSTLHTAQ